LLLFRIGFERFQLTGRFGRKVVELDHNRIQALCQFLQCRIEVFPLVGKLTDTAHPVDRTAVGRKAVGQRIESNFQVVELSHARKLLLVAGEIVLVELQRLELFELKADVVGFLLLFGQLTFQPGKVRLAFLVCFVTGLKSGHTLADPCEGIDKR
jgi:hypothetical protein